MFHKFKGMSKVEVIIEICSNCKQHQWCTRHNEATYFALAQEISTFLKDKDSNVDVNIVQLNGHKMGSF